MANEVLFKVGTPIVIADSVYNPGSANTALGTRTDDIECAGLAAAAAAQSDKIDLGATRAILYDIRTTYEIASDPAAGGSINLYWSPSHSATAAVGNMGLLTGVAGAYTGYVTLSVADSVKHLHHIGTVFVGIQNDADGVNMAHVGLFQPTARYGCLLVVNNCDQAFHADSIEFAVLLEPIVTEVQ